MKKNSHTNEKRQESHQTWKRKSKRKERDFENEPRFNPQYSNSAAFYDNDYRSFQKSKNYTNLNGKFHKSRKN